MAIRDQVQNVRIWFDFLIRYVRDLAAWFATLMIEARLIWLLVLGLAAFVLIVWFFCREQPIRLFGLALELVGIGTVARGLTQTRKGVGEPSFLNRMKQRLEQRPRFGPRQIDPLTVGSASLVFAGSSLRGRGAVAPDSPLEARVAMLEKQQESIYQEVDSLGEKLNQTAAEFSKRLEVEATARQEADTQIDQKLITTVAGGLHLEWIGVVLFALGVIAGTASPELASFFETSCSAL